MTKLISAEEKRKEIEEGWSESAKTLLASCAHKIEKSESLLLHIDVPDGMVDESVERVIRELRSKGWKCKRDKGLGQRMDGAWDILKLDGRTGV